MHVNLRYLILKFRITKDLLYLLCAVYYSYTHAASVGAKYCTIINLLSNLSFLLSHDHAQTKSLHATLTTL